MLSYFFPTCTSCLDVLWNASAVAAAGIALTVATPVLVMIPLQLHRISLAPEGIPWVGQDSYSFFPKLRSTLVALIHERQNLEEGWTKVRVSLDWLSDILADLRRTVQ